MRSAAIFARVLVIGLASARLWKIGGLEASDLGRSCCFLPVVVAVVGVTAKEWDNVYTPVGRTRRLHY